MIAHKRRFYLGLSMMVIFAIVLTIFFTPVFHGKNGLQYLDNLYNSISKGSAYYIPKVKEETKAFSGKKVDVTLSMKNEEQARQAALLFLASHAGVGVEKTQVTVKGDLAEIITNCLNDADAMYKNQGEMVSTKYGYEEKQVLYNWWVSLKEMDKDFKRQKMFKEADFTLHVNKKAVEMAYNYYKIDAQKISERMGIVIFSLIFYVIYTVWYGFAFMFMFEAWGLRLEH